MGAAPMPDGTGVRDGLNVMDRAEAHGWALAWLKRHERKLRLLLRLVKAPITAR